MPQSFVGIPWMRLLLAILIFANLSSALAAADEVPLPRPRPPLWSRRVRRPCAITS